MTAGFGYRQQHPLEMTHMHSLSWKPMMWLKYQSQPPHVRRLHISTGHEELDHAVHVTKSSYSTLMSQ